MWVETTAWNGATVGATDGSGVDAGHSGCSSGPGNIPMFAGPVYRHQDPVEVVQHIGHPAELLFQATHANIHLFHALIQVELLINQLVGIAGRAQGGAPMSGSRATAWPDTESAHSGCYFIQLFPPRRGQSTECSALLLGRGIQYASGASQGASQGVIRATGLHAALALGHRRAGIGTGCAS